MDVTFTKENTSARTRYAYAYRYNGKRVFIYDTDLASLRKKEQQIQADLIDGIRTYESSRLTLNDLFQVYMETKTNLKESTESNYRYLWEHYIQHEPIAEKALSKIHKAMSNYCTLNYCRRGLLPIPWKASTI